MELGVKSPASAPVIEIVTGPIVEVPLLYRSTKLEALPPTAALPKFRGVWAHGARSGVARTGSGACP